MNAESHIGSRHGGRDNVIGTSFTPYSQRADLVVLTAETGAIMTGPLEQLESVGGIHVPFQASDVSINEAVSFKASAQLVTFVGDSQSAPRDLQSRSRHVTNDTIEVLSSSFCDGSDSDEGPDKSGEHLPFKC